MKKVYLFTIYPTETPTTHMGVSKKVIEKLRKTKIKQGYPCGPVTFFPSSK